MGTPMIRSQVLWGKSVRRGLVAIAVLGVMAVVSTACSEGVRGKPQMQLPEDGPSSAGSASENPSSPTGTPSVDIPPRPRDLPVDDVDPCAVFNDAQLAQLKVDDHHSAQDDRGYYKDTKGCIFDVDSEPYLAYYVMTITFEGIEPWLTPDSRNIDPATLVTVGGYSAAQFHFRGAQGFDCITSVDVAEGQQLYVALYPISDGFSNDQLCQMSGQAAEMAVSTLQTLN
jgi:uncharacterized protein DUF3558